MRLAILAALVFLVSLNLNAQTHLNSNSLKLGVVNFKTHTSSHEAHKHFQLGLIYLHNFMYPLALEEFQLAEEADPTFSLSYWGQAMSYKWALWSYVKREKGLQVLAKFKKQKNISMTPLEEGLMKAVSKLYSPGSASQNDFNYLQAMGLLYQKNPNNVDIASFYALALISYAVTFPYGQEGAHYLQEARTILKPFIKSHPQHPGVIHYYLHATDVPNSPFIKEGMLVIPFVYKNLSDSSHVLHMPSHLEMGLGLWNQAAKSNLLSIKASKRLCQFLEENSIIPDSKTKKQPWTEKKYYACDAANRYHSLEWLHYAYLQQGKFKSAQQLLEEMEKIAKIENENTYYFWLYRMRARQILSTKNFKPIKSLPKPLIETSSDKDWAAYSECGLLLANGIAAVKNRQIDFLPLIHQRFDKIISLLTSPSSEGFKNACALAQTEVSAYKHAELEQKYDTCSNELDKVESIQVKLQSSHESLTLPFLTAQEVFGELLMKQSQYKMRIQKLYENELRYFPNRLLAKKGLAQLKSNA